MAKKSTKTKSNKIQRRTRKAKVTPAETTLKYQLPGDGTDVYIDLMRDVSRINRRLYNQGQCVRISHIEIRQDSANQTLGLNTTIKTLPLTWVSAQAYMKARQHWMNQQTHARKTDGSIRPTYEDFKVYMDSGHRAGNTLDVLDGAGNPVIAGEWDYSKFVYADQTVSPEVVRQPHLHMVGADVSNTDVGIINAYEDSRATVQGPDPNVPSTVSTSIYALMMGGDDDGATAAVLNNMEDDNDATPYSKANYPGGAVNYPTNVDKAYLQSSAANPIVSTGGFVAMCGLLRIYSQGKNVTDGSNTNVPGTMLVHLVPGNRKGLLTANVGDLV
jgi:hypothetical protein